MNKTQVIQRFKEHVMPYLCDQSPTTKRCAWNDYTDSLHKCGHINDRQNNNWVHPSCCK
jgi:hypothetical protein